MALYSWFLRTDKKPSIKVVDVKNDILKASKTVKYIENYTMWPTAKIKANVEIIPPSFADTSAKPQELIFPTKTLTTNKS